jgi:hypothetical protein
VKGIDNAKDLGVDGRIIFECISGKQVWKLWNGFIWLRIGTGGGLL